MSSYPSSTTRMARSTTRTPENTPYSANIGDTNVNSPKRTKPAPVLISGAGFAVAKRMLRLFAVCSYRTCSKFSRIGGVGFGLAGVVIACPAPRGI